MKSNIFKRSQWVDRPVHSVFDFFSQPRNLELLTPDWLRFCISSVEPIEMGVGTLIDYKLYWHGFPIRWRSEITAWEPPNRFVDLQIRGPYRLWRHEHRFLAENGGTRIFDEVQYALPWNPIGPIARRLVLRDLKAIFDYRAQKVSESLSPQQVVSL